MPECGVLIISHGSRDAKWVQLVRDACTAVKLPEALKDAPVECAFLELVEGSLIQDGIDRLEQAGVREMIVVPLFISSGSTHMDEIAWALGVKEQPALETDIEPYRVQARIHLCEPIDDDPEIAEILAEKLAPLSTRPAEELVLLVGHGSQEPGFHERWQRGLTSLAEQVKQLGGYAAADTVMLLPDQAASTMLDWQRKRPDLKVLLAPVFLSEGYFTNKVIPQRFNGYAYQYNGQSLLPSPRVTAWMERKIRERWALIGAGR